MILSDSGTMKARMNRTRRRWMSTAFVALTTAMIDFDGSYAFSPSADAKVAQLELLNPPSAKRGSTSRSHTSCLETATSKVSISSNILTTFDPKNPLEPTKKKQQVSQSARHKIKTVSSNDLGLTASSRATAMGKQNRNSRMLRSTSLNSSPRFRNRRAPILDHGGLLDKAQERKLTITIRSLRRAVRIRDELVEARDCVPSEADWAKACKLSVIGLRRVMYEGQQARTVLVSANVGLVTSIAKRHFSALKHATEAGGGVGTILTIQDLIQEGNLGLMQAAERFEADRGHRFSTYATYWIKQRILRAISDSSRIIRLPAHVHSMLQKIRKAKKAVGKEIGRTPSALEIAQYLEVSVDELAKYTSRTRNVVSLESPLRSGGTFKEDSRTIGDLIASDAPTPEEDAQRQSLKSDIQAVVSELAEQEQEVLVLRFGLENGESLTATQTAKELGMSVDRVRMFETRALNKLRSPQRNYRLKEYVGVDESEEEHIVEEVEMIPEKIWFF